MKQNIQSLFAITCLLSILALQTANSLCMGLRDLLNPANTEPYSFEQAEMDLERILNSEIEIKPDPEEILKKLKESEAAIIGLLQDTSAQGTPELKNTQISSSTLAEQITSQDTLDYAEVEKQGFNQKQAEQHATIQCSYCDTIYTGQLDSIFNKCKIHIDDRHKNCTVCHELHKNTIQDKVCKTIARQKETGTEKNSTSFSNIQLLTPNIGENNTVLYSDINVKSDWYKQHKNNYFTVACGEDICDAVYKGKLYIARQSCLARKKALHIMVCIHCGEKHNKMSEARKCRENHQGGTKPKKRKKG